MKQNIQPQSIAIKLACNGTFLMIANRRWRRQLKLFNREITNARNYSIQWIEIFFLIISRWMVAPSLPINNNKSMYDKHERSEKNLIRTKRAGRRVRSIFNINGNNFRTWWIIHLVSYYLKMSGKITHAHTRVVHVSK